MSNEFCPWCGDPLTFEGEKLGYKWCSRKCMNADYYHRNKELHRKRYNEAKKELRKSGLNISMFKWWKLPTFWRKREI